MWSLRWGWCFWQFPCKSQGLRSPIIDTVSPISADIGPNLGGMIISGIRSSMDEALGSLQSLLKGSGTIPGWLAGPQRGPGGTAVLRAGVRACSRKAPREEGPSGFPAAAWAKCWDFGGVPLCCEF